MALSSGHGEQCALPSTPLCRQREKKMAPEAHPPHGQEDSSRMAGILERNIQALLAHRRQEERTRGVQDRIADGVTRFAGSMRFVFLHLVAFGLWIVINLGGTPLPRFDPTFVILAMFASVEAIFLSTFVLITQNRMAAQADQRADLDLQISLLAEHEVTRLITLVSEIAERMGIETERYSELPELKRDVRPEQVLDKIEEMRRHSDRTPREDNEQGR
ncbi:MAG: DUF1003 domain-containing protein [Thermodesulfovibrionales bacterium]